MAARGLRRAASAARGAARRGDRPARGGSRGPRALPRVTDTVATAEEPRELTPPPAPPAPLEVFNESSEVRKVSGLMKSLGEPRVCIRRGRRGEGTLIVVAWDLSWYRWSVQGQLGQAAGEGQLGYPGAPR